MLSVPLKPTHTLFLSKTGIPTGKKKEKKREREREREREKKKNQKHKFLQSQGRAYKMLHAQL